MKYLKPLGALVVFGAIIFAGWYYKPWSDYSPAEMAHANSKDPAIRVESFRAMKDIFPYNEIKGAGQVVEFRANEQPLGDISFDVDGTIIALKDYVNDHYLTGLVVLKDGVLVHQSYYKGEQAEDRHTSWSVAKSYIATMIGMAVLDGTIASLDDPVAKYSKSFKGSDFGDTSLRHLLMMSSGIQFVEDYETKNSDMRKLFFSVFVHNKDPDKSIRRYKRTKEPGQELHYISPNTHVLSAVLRDAYGMSISELADKKIFKPLGMASAYWSKSNNKASGKEIGYCCLNTRALDYAKLGQLYLQDGIWEGQRLLPEGWTDFVRTPVTQTHKPGKGPYFRLGYGHHFWLPPVEYGGTDGVYYAGGYNGQMIWIDPRRNIVIVQTASDTWFDENANHKSAAIDAIADYFAGQL